MSGTRKGYALVLASAVGFALATFFARMAFVRFPDQDPFNVAFWGWFSGMTGASLLYLWSKKNQQKLIKVVREDKFLILSVGFLTALGGVFWFFALEAMTAGIVSLFDQLIVVWSFILSYIFLGERARFLSLIGLIIAALGLLFVSSLEGQVSLWGITCSFVATINIAVQSVILKKYAANTDSLALTFLRGWSIVVVAGLVFGLWGKLNSPDSGEFIFIVFLSQFFGLFLARAAYINAHKYLEVNHLASINIVIPVITLVLSFLFLGESMDSEKIIGAFLIVLGLLWFLKFKSAK